MLCLFIGAWGVTQVAKLSSGNVAKLSSGNVAKLSSGNWVSGVGVEWEVTATVVIGGDSLSGGQGVGLGTLAGVCHQGRHRGVAANVWSSPTRWRTASCSERAFSAGILLENFRRIIFRATQDWRFETGRYSIHSLPFILSGWFVQFTSTGFPLPPTSGCFVWTFWIFTG